MSPVTSVNGAYLQLNNDTVENVRKECNLDKAGVMEQAIDILHKWIQKQEHFEKKKFPREYLEGFIISSKGSVEKAKTRIDRVCTMRTLEPHLFEKYHARNDFSREHVSYIDIIIPVLTKDNYRIHVGKFISKNITPSVFLAMYQRFIILAEYLKLYDYAKGYIAIYDLTNINIMDLISNMNLVDFRNTLALCTEAYGFRIKNIYFITSSNTIHNFVKIVKQFISAKIGERICVLKTVESLHEFLPKHYLPKDLGGEQKSTLDLYDDLNDELSTEEHIAHMKEMREAGINEALRSEEQLNTDLGMPGSFKTLSFD